MGSGAFGGAASGAAQGALIGSIVPGVGTAVGAAVGGGLGLLGGMAGDKQAAAAQGAAEAQQRAASEAQSVLMRRADDYEKRVMNLATASPQELQQHERALRASEQQLAGQERLFGQINPVLLEASKQALALLRGERSPASSAFANQRAQQREQLLGTLRNQLGPGAESTSAGSRALREFDAQTTMLMQQQASGLGQLAGSFASINPNLQQSAAGQLGLASAFRERELGALERSRSAGLSALSGAQQPVIQTAGAGYIGDQIRAQQQQAMFGDLMKTAGYVAGAKSFQAQAAAPSGIPSSMDLGSQYAVAPASQRYGLGADTNFKFGK